MQANNKNILYKQEREQLFVTLQNIIGITNNNFIFYDLEQDEDKKKKILALLDDIKKFYRYDNYHSILTAKKNKWFLVMKFIYRKNGYSFYTKKYEVIKNDNKIKTIRYAVIKE